MIKLALIFLLAIASVCSAQDRPAGAPFYFNITTAVSGGTFTNADSAPTWTLLKDGATPITTGTFSVAGTGTLAANYYGSLTLNAASFTVGTSSYAIEATGTISAVPVKSIVMQGRVLPAEPSAGVTQVQSINGPAYIAGTATGGGASTIGLASATGAEKGNLILITGGTGSTEARTIVFYSAGVATVDRDWTVTPNATTTYRILTADGPQVKPNLSVLAGGGTVDTAVSLTANNDKTGYTVASSGIGSNAFTSGAITASVMTQQAMDLVWSSATRSLTDKANFTLTVTPPTASQIVTAIMTDLLNSSDFNTAASFGKLIKDNIDSPISSGAGGLTLDEHKRLVNLSHGEKTP
jgi:hypothetical protein